MAGRKHKRTQTSAFGAPGREGHDSSRFYIQDMLEIGFLMRGEIIWNKGASAGTSTAWGSWKSPVDPTLRDVHECILAFSKEAFNRKKLPGREATITKEEFLEFTKSVWTFPAESATQGRPPGPFPGGVALPPDPALHLQGRCGAGPFHR